MIGQKRLDVNSNFDFVEWQIKQDTDIATNTANIAANTQAISEITGITVDTVFNGSSNNAIANSTVTNEFNTANANITDNTARISANSNSINSLWTAVNNIGGGGTATSVTLFENSSYTSYLTTVLLNNSSWDSNYYNITECTTTKNIPSFCSSSYDYTLRPSNAFGWTANLTIIFNNLVTISNSTLLDTLYYCSSNGNDITADIVDDLTGTNILASFGLVQSFYVDDGDYLRVIYSNLTNLTNSVQGYLRFRMVAGNSIYQFKQIKLSTTTI